MRAAFITSNETRWKMHFACDDPLSVFEYPHQCFTGFGGSEDIVFYDYGSSYRHPDKKVRKSRGSGLD